MKQWAKLLGPELYKEKNTNSGISKIFGKRRHIEANFITHHFIILKPTNVVSMINASEFIK